jgi:hypothetical protein
MWYITGRGSLSDVSTLIANASRSWFGGFYRYSTNQTLTSTQAGRVLWFVTGGLSCALPTPSTMAAGQTFTIKNGSDGNLTVTTPSGAIYADLDSTSAASLVLAAREWAEIGTDGTNWSVNLRGSLVASAAATSAVVNGGMTINGTATDYDVRAICTGGTGAVGGGTLTLQGGRVDVNALLSANSSFASAGPIKYGAYTLTTLPSASAFSGYIIDVTNATGGAKTCRSNGTVWQVLNTTTTVN